MPAHGETDHPAGMAEERPPQAIAATRPLPARLHPLLIALGIAALALLAVVALQPRSAAAQEALPDEVETALRDDLATRANVQAGDIEMVRVEAVTWTDGCLGVYPPGVACTLALVDGFVAWAVAEDVGYRYHTSMSGAVFAAGDIDPASIASAPLPPGTTPPPPGEGVVAGEIPLTGGFGLIAFGGGTYDELVAATGCPLATARFWATVDGVFVVLIPGTQVAAVNAAFEALFAGAIPAGTLLIGTCPPAASTTGISGTVTEGPITPVCVEGDPCERPLVAILLVRDASGGVVAQTQSAADGTYRIELPPGSYAVEPLTPGDGPFPIAQTVNVTVGAEGFVTLDIEYDTGIR